MSRRQFSLTPQLDAFIEKEIRSGRHQSESEVVQEALRRYEDDIADERADRAIVEAVAVEGGAAIARGEFVTVRGPDGAKQLLDRLNEKASIRAAGDRSDHG